VQVRAVHVPGPRGVTVRVCAHACTPSHQSARPPPPPNTHTHTPTHSPVHTHGVGVSPVHLLCACPQAPAGAFDEKSDMHFYLRIALHTSDVSNPARPKDFSLEWTNRVVAEFFQQGDKERDAGLPISTFYDRCRARVPGRSRGHRCTSGMTTRCARGYRLKLPPPLRAGGGHRELCVRPSYCFRAREAAPL
jgi:hypothetical protein